MISLIIIDLIFDSPGRKMLCPNTGTYSEHSNTDEIYITAAQKNSSRAEISSDSDNLYE